MSLRFQLALLLALTVLFAGRTCADGLALAGRDLSSVSPLREGEQRSAIVHRNGVQKMIIAVNFELDDAERALWILPVPGPANQVRVDVLDAFPRIGGRDPRRIAFEQITGWPLAIRATQFWPLPFDFLLYVPFQLRSGAQRMGAEVEKWGVHAEAVTAESLAALTSFLKEKKVGVSPEHLTGFQPYLSKRYVIVLAWISSREQLLREFPGITQGGRPSRDRWPCLYLEFPTSRAFYPLRPTSVYGEQSVRVRLALAGFVEPQTSASLASQLDVSYLTTMGLKPRRQVPRDFGMGFPLRVFCVTQPFAWMRPREPSRMICGLHPHGLQAWFTLISSRRWQILHRCQLW